MLKVLIVEDELLIAMSLEEVLTELGHEVVGIATTSKEAEVLAETTQPELALVDITLADGPTGVDLARGLCEKGIGRVVFTSANVNRIPADFAGALGSIAKPYTENGIRAAMAYVMKGLTNPPPDLPAPPSLALAPLYRRQWAS